MEVPIIPIIILPFYFFIPNLLYSKVGATVPVY